MLPEIFRNWKAKNPSFRKNFRTGEEFNIENTLASYMRGFKKKEEEKEEKNKKEKKIPRWLKVLIENSHRWAGVVAGPPGSGKTTFLRMLTRYVDVVMVSVKENSLPKKTLLVPEEVIVKRISAVLHFAAEGIKPSFDVLRGKTLEEIENQLGKFKNDIAEWIQARIRVIKNWKKGENIEVPLYLKDSDELERRIVLGILYVSRHLFPIPFLLDDTMAFVVDKKYGEAFYAMMRPYLASVNRYLDSKELLNFNPVIITPGGAGVSVAPRHGPHRLARRDKYVILFDGHRFEVPLQEVRKLVQSQ